MSGGDRLWEDNWDDDDVEEDFSLQLRCVAIRLSERFEILFLSPINWRLNCVLQERRGETTRECDATVIYRICLVVRHERWSDLSPRLSTNVRLQIGM